MQKTFHSSKYATYYLVAILLLLLSSCDKILITPYFKCEINGEKFKTHNQPIAWGSQPPITTYYSNSFFSFYTKLSPEDESISSPFFFFDFCQYMNTPPQIGEKYFFSAQSGKEHSVSLQELEPLKKDRISYASLCLAEYYPDGLSLGSGYFQLTEISEDGRWIKGIVESEFVSPIEKDGERELLKLKGEFCSILLIK